jgi:hypothetical protein
VHVRLRGSHTPQSTGRRADHSERIRAQNERRFQLQAAAAPRNQPSAGFQSSRAPTLPARVRGSATLIMGSVRPSSVHLGTTVNSPHRDATPTASPLSRVASALGTTRQDRTRALHVARASPLQRSRATPPQLTASASEGIDPARMDGLPTPHGQFHTHAQPTMGRACWRLHSPSSARADVDGRCM